MENEVIGNRETNEVSNGLGALELEENHSRSNKSESDRTEGHPMSDEHGKPETPGKTDALNVCRELVLYRPPFSINYFSQEVLNLIAEHAIEPDYSSKCLPLLDFRLAQRRFARAGQDAIIKFLRRDEAADRKYMTLPMQSTLKSFRRFEAILKNPPLRKFMQGIKMVPTYLPHLHPLCERTALELGRDIEEFQERFGAGMFTCVTITLPDDYDSDVDDDPFEKALLFHVFDSFCIKSLEFVLPDPDEGRLCVTSGVNERNRADQFEKLMTAHHKTIETLVIDGWPIASPIYIWFPRFSANFKKLAFKFVWYNPVNQILLSTVLQKLSCLPDLDLGIRGFGDVKYGHESDCTMVLHQLRTSVTSLGRTIKTITLRDFIIRDWNDDFLEIDMPLLTHLYLERGVILDMSLSDLVDDTLSSKPNIKTIEMSKTNFDHIGNGQAATDLHGFRGRVPSQFIMSSRASISCDCWSGHFKVSKRPIALGTVPVCFEVKYIGTEDCPMHWVAHTLAED